jgi:enamine deaminase RidA (YjgF/YER057c/UK114 family)
MEGAQVVLESTAMEKRIVNPDGLAFFSGQQAPSAAKAVEQLRVAVQGAGVNPTSVLRTTCFLNSLDQLQAARSSISTAFPMAVTNYVQLQRQGLQPLAECEAVGRLEKAPASPVVLLNPPGLEPSPRYSQVAVVSAPKLVISGTQMAFGGQDSDIRLAFERLQKALDQVGATYKDVFYSSTYSMTLPIQEKARTIRFEFFERSRPPASTSLVFEGLPALDGTMAFDVIAAPAK